MTFVTTYLKVKMNEQCVILVLSLFCALSSYFKLSNAAVAVGTCDGCPFELVGGKLYQLAVESSRTYMFHLDVSPSTSHVVFQAHTQWNVLNLSFADGQNCTNVTHGRFINGSDIGIVSLLDKTGRRNVDPTTWCLSLIAPVNVTAMVLLVATEYSRADPIPGGCNQELSLENDPNLYLVNANQMSLLEFAYGDVNNGNRGCGSTLQHAEAVYDVYQLYLSERHLDEAVYMQVLSQMIEPHAIANTANKITSIRYADKTAAKFAAYTGQGVVYAVVMQLKNLTSSQVMQNGIAAYVPVVTYSCNKTQDSCVDQPAFANMIVVCVLGALGLVICLFGHRLFVLEMFFFGYLGAQLITYILAVRFLVLSPAGYMYVSVIFGVVGGLLWSVLWMCLGSPVLSMFLVALEFGYIISSTVLLMTPLGKIETLLIEYIYQTVFFTGLLVIALLMIAVSLHKLSLLSCSVIGSYLVVLSVDWFLHGSLRQIALNSIRKSAIPGFANAYITVPFQFSDILLCVLWIVLAVIGFIVQYLLVRKRRQFPVAWCAARRRRRYTGNSDETQPLLGSSQASTWQPGSNMWHPNELSDTAAEHT